MAKNYKEVPWWWYMVVLVFSFILGLVVVIKENITMPAWAYVVSLIVGIIIAPFVSALHLLLGADGISADNVDTECSDLRTLRQWYCY